MYDDMSRWKRLDEVEARRKEQKNVGELHSDGYRSYCQCQFSQAANLFSQAAALAKQTGDLSAQCKNLNWEGTCYRKNGKLKRALALFLKAEELGELDAITQFYNLIDMYSVACDLGLSRAEIQLILDKLTPYKNVQQIGGSKSMVLSSEYRFLSLCGQKAEALAKAQEAFASRIYQLPSYNDGVYYRELISAYRSNGQISEAWTILHRWRKEGSAKFANVKRNQLMEELELYCYEDKFGEAWDVLQNIKAEEQYLGRRGMYIDTLDNEILVGIKMGRLEQVKPALRMIFKKYRNSECLIDRYCCYRAFARYYCASWHATPHENRRQMEWQTEFWLRKAEQMAEHLDDLLQTTKRMEAVQKIRQSYRKPQVNPKVLRH